MSRTLDSHRTLLRRRRRAIVGVELLESRTLLAVNLAGGIVADQLLDAAASIQATIVSANNPVNHIVPAGSAFDGVGRVEVRAADGSVLGFASGTLIAGGAYVLTAAHVVADASQAIISWPNAGISSVFSSEFFVHPDWNDNPLDANDIALIKLLTPITTAPSYGLYRGAAEVGAVATITGYGLSGTGQTGAVNGTYGTLRSVENRLDDTYTPSSSLPRSEHPMLAFDFDSGSFWHDTIGLFFGIRDRGLGSAREGMFALGDSGGATFLNVAGKWQVAGVNSFIMSFGSIFDSSRGVNSSFGELGFVTRVSAYDDWVDDVIEGEATGTAATAGAAAADQPGNTRRVRLPDGTFITLTDFDLTAVPPTVQAPRAEFVTFLAPPNAGVGRDLPTAFRGLSSESGTLVAGHGWFPSDPVPVTDDAAIAVLNAFWTIFGNRRQPETTAVRSEQQPPSGEENEKPSAIEPERMATPPEEKNLEESGMLPMIWPELDEYVLPATNESALTLEPALAMAVVAFGVGSWNEGVRQQSREKPHKRRRSR